MVTETWAITGAVGFLALGLLTAWVVRRLLATDSPALVIALMLLPVVTYLVLSGRVGQLKAGDLEAKFISAARQPVRVESGPVEAALTPVQVTSRGLIEELPDRLASIRPGEPVILTVTLGRRYTRETWLEYIRAILEKARLAYAAVLDTEGRLVAYMDVPALQRVLARFELGGELIRAIAENDRDAITAFPGARTRALSTSDPAIRALRMMKERGQGALLAVDAERRIAGIVNRDDVLAQIILDMAEASGRPTGVSGE